MARLATERFEIPVDHAQLDAVSALWHEAPARARRASAILLAHGAGLDMDSPWMSEVADGLVARGFGVLRFNYPYKERAARRGKSLPPDRRPVLEAAHARALDALIERAGERRALLAGKSMGGRMATLIAAKDAPCRGLILFGYPLHPPRKRDERVDPKRLRREHFPAIVQPALFLQGTRDALCDLELLGDALRTYGGTATLEVIEDADHGFHVLKRTGLTDDEVRERMLDRVAAWESETFPS